MDQLPVDELRKEIELEVVELLKTKLESGEITEKRAQQISEQVLSRLHEGMTYEELYSAISNLDNSMTELAVIVLPFVRDHEKQVQEQGVGALRELIKQGQYDAAAKLGRIISTSDSMTQWQGEGEADTTE